jgi:hypothetical protein
LHRIAPLSERAKRVGKTSARNHPWGAPPLM